MSDEDRPKHPGGRPTKYDPVYCDMVGPFMAQGYSLTAFAGEIDVSRSTIELWTKEHPEFSGAVSRAKAKTLLSWETRARQCGDGLLGNGAAGMIAFALKNFGGDDWRDKQEVEHSGKGGGPIQTVGIVSNDPVEAARVYQDIISGRNTGK